MPSHRRPLRVLKITMLSLIGLAGTLAALWWALFALKPYALAPGELAARHAVPPEAGASAAAQLRLTPASAEGLPGVAFDLQGPSFDGAPLLGRIVFPRDPRDPEQAGAAMPLLLALHGLGRTHQRWWLAELRGRPTLENTHRLTELALRQGYAVLALDARMHGQRKAGFAASELLEDMHWWGRREPYERMVVDSVRDYRVALDWALAQPQIDAGRVAAAGYSMGAQMALLLAGVDTRVQAVAAMVPPHLDDKVAVVAPRNAMAGLAGKRVWLLSADDDDYAPQAANAALFDAIPAADKRHLRFAGGHALPADYVEQLRPWFAAPPGSGASAPVAR